MPDTNQMTPEDYAAFTHAMATGKQMPSIADKLVNRCRICGRGPMAFSLEAKVPGVCEECGAKHAEFQEKYGPDIVATCGKCGKSYLTAKAAAECPCGSVAQEQHRNQEEKSVPPLATLKPDAVVYQCSHCGRLHPMGNQAWPHMRCNCGNYYWMPKPAAMFPQPIQYGVPGTKPITAIPPGRLLSTEDQTFNKKPPAQVDHEKSLRSANQPTVAGKCPNCNDTWLCMKDTTTNILHPVRRWYAGESIRCFKCGQDGVAIPVDPSEKTPEMVENPWVKAERLEKELAALAEEPCKECEKQIEKADHWYKESCKLGEELTAAKKDRDEWKVSAERLHEKFLQSDATLSSAKAEAARYYAQVKEMDKSVSSKQDECENLFADNETLKKIVEDRGRGLEIVQKDTEYWMNQHTKAEERTNHFVEALNRGTLRQNELQKELQEAERRAKCLEDDLMERRQWLMLEKDAHRRARNAAWCFGTGWFLLSICYLAKFFQ